jgi:DNA-binding MarR family transcriptional regulator
VARTQGNDSADETGLIDALVQSAFAVMAVLNRLAADNDLSLTQLRVLAILRDRRLGMTALAAYLGLEKSTMTGLVERAEKRGLLQRAPHAVDGRAVDVFISAAGAALAERIYDQVTASLAPVIGTLTGSDQRRLQALLERMIGRVGRVGLEPTTEGL